MKFQNPVQTGVGGPGLMWEAMKRRLTNKAETVPKVMPGPFTTDVAVLGRTPESGLRVTWFGHSALLVELDGVTVLMDPMWDERASPVSWGGPKRFWPVTMRLEDLPRVDAVVISHDHYDHLGSATVRALARLLPEMRWVAPLGVGRVLAGFGVDLGRVTELDWTEATTVAGANGAEAQLTAVPARHFSGRYPWGRYETLWAAFVLRGSAHAVYLGADTGLWPGLATIGREYGPFDVAMLEIGAYDRLWGDIHLGPDGAMEAFAGLNAEMMMPVHWGLFDLGLHGWRQPMERLLELMEGSGVRLFQPEPGVPTEVLAGMEVRSEWFRDSVGQFKAR